MRINEIRDLSSEELATRAAAAKESHFRLRLRHSTGQLEKPTELLKTRKERARMLTVLRERELGLVAGHDVQAHAHEAPAKEKAPAKHAPAKAAAKKGKAKKAAAHKPAKKTHAAPKKSAAKAAKKKK